MLLLRHHFLLVIKRASIGTAAYVACRLIHFFLKKKPAKVIEYEGEGHFLLHRRTNGEKCAIHVMRRESCSEGCRYAFLTWLISCIDGAKKHLDLCMYFLGDESLTDALIRAKQRDVKVRVIVSSVEDDNHGMGAMVLKLRKAHIRIHAMKTALSQVMHLKMMVVDHEYVIYGSTNFMTSAIANNSDEMMKLTNPSIVSDCSQYIQGIWSDIAESNAFHTRIRICAEKILSDRKKDLAALNAQNDDVGMW